MRRLLGLIAIGVAGLLCSLVVIGAAFAWAPNPLPAGFSITSHGIDSSATTCPEWYVLIDANVTPNQRSGNLCDQSAIDAWVAAEPQAPSTTTTAAATTTASTPTTTAATPTTTSTGSSTTPTPGTTTTATPTATTQTVTTTTTTTAAATPPAASFTSSATGLTVTFTDTSSVKAPATLETVTWHFGDGNNGTGATVQHVYNAGGTFTVVEIVTDSNGLASQATEQIPVSPFAGVATFRESVSPALSAATTRAVRVPVSVFCVSSWGAVKAERDGYGLTIVGSKQANIWAKGCAALRTGKRPVALALLVLGHEVAHSLGVTSERAADCYALARVPALAHALGVVKAARGAVKRDAALIRKRYGSACPG